METFCVVAAVMGLMSFAYFGWSIILIAPLLTMVAALAGELSVMPVYTELYMTNLAEYTKAYYPIFLFGAVFARLMEKGGLASAVAGKIMSVLGVKRAVLAVILGAGALTYGGLSVFVVAFVMYPFGAEVFRKADIPKRLLPATLWIGIFSFAMVALPGSPQIQNIIPASYFGTSAWAGPATGLFASAVFLALGLVYLNGRAQKLKTNGEGYGDETGTRQRKERNLPTFGLAVIPLVSVVVINMILSNPFHWDENSLANFTDFNLPLLATSVGKTSAVWSITAALAISSAAAALIGRKRLKNNKETFIDTINFGAASSCAAVLNVASGFAFGACMVALPGFLPLKAALMNLSDSMGPLVSAVITTNIMSGITGSASGGLTIALNMGGETWAAMALNAGIPLEVLHRVVSVASVGIDPVPHCGALVTLLAVCGLTHKESYFDIAALMLLKFFVPFMCIAFYMLTGLT